MFAWLLAALAVALMMRPATAAGQLGDQCRQGNIANCQKLCSRGFQKACAHAKGRTGGGAHSGPMVEFGEKTIAEVRRRGLLHTGLVPIYPTNAECPRVASGFAATTRYDGSVRTPRAMFGLHEGMDISLPIGTSIIAIASGTLIHKRHGPLLIGNEVFVRHSPQETGLKVWTFAKYKHFSKLTPIHVGDKIKVGEVLGPSGNTGTVGGYYGPNGYAHLHLSTYWNADGAYKIENGRVLIADPHYVDPAAFLSGREINSAAIRKLPSAERKVAIPYKTDTGAVFPKGTKVLWPVLCKSRQVSQKN